MRKVKIITDSCSDLTAELMEKYNIDYGRMSTVCDGVETPALLTWNEKDVHNLYDTMRRGKRVTTTQVSVEEFNRIFKKYLSDGYDIVYIGCSSKQSGSVNTSQVVATKLLLDYPDAQISCIDSLNASIGEGMLAIEAAKMAAEGKSVSEITSYITDIRKNVWQFATVHSLDTLKKAGRVTGSSAFFGNLMGVKPIITADAAGDQAAYKKVKGRQNSFEEIVNLLKENIVNESEQTVYIVHADCSKEEVDNLVKLVKDKIACKDIHIGYIGPIIGASIGPDAIGVWAFGNKVTYCANEK